MKSNKGVLTILANLAELILQTRISPSETHNEHLNALRTQLQLLRNQLLPSTEIMHFLVQRHHYHIKNKINSFLKTANLEQLVLTITFTVTCKATSMKHVAEMWKFGMVLRKQGDVSREGRAHELLLLVERLFEQLHSREFFIQATRNHQALKKYIIDFQIQMKQQNIPNLTLSQFGKLTFNSASLDNSRSLQVWRYSRCKQLPSIFIYNKKIPKFNHSNKLKPTKNSLQTTRGGSFEQQSLLIKKTLISEEKVFEIYDSELDVTILSSDSESLSPKSNFATFQNEVMQQFELLIEDKDKDELFLQQNKLNFQNWQLYFFQNFI